MKKTNEDIISKMEELHNVTHLRLDELHAKVEKNTNWRLLHIGGYKIICIIGACVVGIVSMVKGVFHG